MLFHGIPSLAALADLTVNECMTAVECGCEKWERSSSGEGAGGPACEHLLALASSAADEGPNAELHAGWVAA